MTFSVDSKVRQCATLINDNILLGKLAGGDLIAAEAKYHPTCLLSLYRKIACAHADADESNLDDDSVAINVNSESLALAELIAYMENIKIIESTPTVFKLSELSKIYSGH